MNLARKLKRGSRKYKRKLPFKCFSYGKVGHFAAKCPYNKSENEHEISKRQGQKKQYNFKRKKNFKKKSLIIKDSENSLDSSDNENYVVLFMAAICPINNEINQNTHFGKENQQDVEIDLEGELICALK